MKKYITAIIILFSSVCFGGEMEQGKADAQKLMNAVLPLPEQMLTRHGEFYPYGSAMRPNGEIVSVSAYEGSDNPSSSELISLLKKGFDASAKANDYRATALVYDVRVPLPETGVKSDAIAIDLDHKSGYSVVVFLPYTIENGELRFGSTLAQAGEGAVFK